VAYIFRTEICILAMQRSHNQKLYFISTVALGILSNMKKCARQDIYLKKYFYLVHRNEAKLNSS